MGRKRSIKNNIRLSLIENINKVYNKIKEDINDESVVIGTLNQPHNFTNIIINVIYDIDQQYSSWPYTFTIGMTGRDIERFTELNFHEYLYDIINIKSWKGKQQKEILVSYISQYII